MNAAETTTRSRRRRPLRSTSAPTARRSRSYLAGCAGSLRWVCRPSLGWVVGMDDIRPIEVMGREVIPAVADL